MGTLNRFVSVQILGLAVLAVACSTSAPYKQPIATTPIQPAAGEAVDADRMIVLFDASGSIDARDEFPDEKAWVESFVQGMPEGDYDVSIRSFGGERRRGVPLSDFDREQLAATANDLDYIGGGSPLAEVLGEMKGDLAGAQGKTAILVVSDGVPDAPKWGQSPEPAVDEAKAIAEGAEGPVCFHTVLAGDDDTGRALLTRISTVTSCGSFRDSSSLGSADGLSSFQNDIFIAAAPVAAVPVAAVAVDGDADGDGVKDSADECPGTPAGAPVDDRGCWVLQGIRFGSGSAEIVAASSAVVSEVMNVLEGNPDMRFQIDGYTDSTGPAAFNQQLSQQRAEAVKTALVGKGIDASRLEAVGHGESNPVADNATSEGRAQNRRIEFSVLD